MRQISEALPRPQINPQDFRYQRDNSKSLDIHIMIEDYKSIPKQ